MFIKDEFYSEAKEYVKVEAEKTSDDSTTTEGKLTQAQMKTKEEMNIPQRKTANY